MRLLAIMPGLIAGLTFSATADAEQRAPVPERNVCTGTVTGIETSQDDTPGAWLWLINQHCRHGSTKDQPTEFALTRAQSGEIWHAALEVASAAYARSGTVTVEYDWTEGMSTSAVPRITRINAPCMSGMAGGC